MRWPLPSDLEGFIAWVEINKQFRTPVNENYDRSLLE